MINFEIINEKKLDSEELLGVTKVCNTLSEFFDVNCAVIINNSRLCGVALGSSLAQAYNKAFDCDPVSSFSGILGLSKVVTADIAKHINSANYKVVVAPDFSKDVVELLKNNPNIKLVKLNTSLKEYKKLMLEDENFEPFGVALENSENGELNKDTFKVVTKQKPTPEQIEDAVFAWKVAKHALNNSVVVVRDFKTNSIIQDVKDQVSSIEQALDIACDGAKEAILAVDFSITDEECIYSAIQDRISLIIQSGGSENDTKLVQICDKYSIAMITTGI